MNTADLIWLNGEFVAWEDAKVHVLTHALHYGTGVFEGAMGSVSFHDVVTPDLITATYQGSITV